MAKKVKIKKHCGTNLTKAKLSTQGFKSMPPRELPSEYERTHIFKTLALLGDKTGPIIGIVPITEHLSEKKLAKISGNKKSEHDSSKGLRKNIWLFMEPIILSVFVKTQLSHFYRSDCFGFGPNDCLCWEVRHSIIVRPQDLASFVKS